MLSNEGWNNVIVRPYEDCTAAEAEGWFQSVTVYSNISVNMLLDRERSGSVVECLTRDRGAAGSSLPCVTALCP